MDREAKYEKPVLLRLSNLKYVTFTKPSFNCSVPTDNGVGNNGCDNGNHGRP